MKNRALVSILALCVLFSFGVAPDIEARAAEGTLLETASTKEDSKGTFESVDQNPSTGKNSSQAKSQAQINSNAPDNEDSGLEDPQLPSTTETMSEDNVFVPVVPLATTVVTDEASLVAAISAAASGDTIDFGGATITVSSPLILDKSLVFANGSLKVAGAVRHMNIIAPATLTLSSMTFAGNRTGTNDTTPGGGIEITAVGDVRIEGAGRSGKIANSYTPGNGGGISTADSTNLVINELILENNGAGGNGGGIYAEGKLNTLWSFVDNNSAANGGGIYYASVSGTAYVMGGGRIYGNTASSKGGGVYGVSEVRFEYGSEIANNTADSGGGIYAEAAATVIHGTAIYNNNAITDGGGIYLNGSSSLARLDGNGRSDGNTAGGNGGGIYANGANLIAAAGDSSLSNNKAINGAGIYVATASTEISITVNTKMLGNAASGDGGGIYSPGHIGIGGTPVIENNQAIGNGGVIYAAGSVEISGTPGGGMPTVNNNTAGNNGGAIYLTTTGSSAILGAGNFTNNKATAGLGGAIYVQKFDQLTAGPQAVLFSGNTASSAYPWLLDEDGMELYKALYLIKIKGATYSTISGSDNIYNNYDMNFAAEISAPPVVNVSYVGDQLVSGTGIANSTIYITFPDGSKIRTLVSSNGTWEVPLPSSTRPLAMGEFIKARQVELGKGISSEAIGEVFGSVSYIANGANQNLEQLPPKTAHRLAENITVQSPGSLGRTGYSFSGWQRNDAGKTINQPGDTFSMPGENVTLTAQWKANNYSLKFDANSGSGSMTNVPIDYDQSIDLPSNSFTHPGYSFVGWSTDLNATNGSYADGGSYTQTETNDVTLYAIWLITPYGVSFNANGGEGSMSPMQITYQETKALPANSFTRPGYTFAGWSLEENASTVDYADQSSYTHTTTNNVVLNAVWKEATDTPYIIEHYQQNSDLSGYTKVDADTEALRGTTNSPIAPLEPKDYSGYYYHAEKTTYENSTRGASTEELTIAPDGSLIVKLYYDRIVYILDFNANGGQGVTDPMAIRKDQTVSLSPNDFTREGYTFLGWSTDPTATEAEYADLGSYTQPANSDATLYAIWKLIEVTPPEKNPAPTPLPTEHKTTSQTKALLASTGDSLSIWWPLSILGLSAGIFLFATFLRHRKKNRFTTDIR